MKKRKKQELYCIYDYDDPQTIFAVGSLRKLKEWWWKHLTSNTEVGGYALDKYDKIKAEQKELDE